MNTPYNYANLDTLVSSVIYGDLDKMISEGFIEDDESEEYYDLEGVI